MSKFIELIVDGEKHLFNADTIFEIEPMKSGCRVYQTVYAPRSIDFTNVVVDESYEQVKAFGSIDCTNVVVGESYEQVKALLAGDTNVPDKITAKLVEDAMLAWEKYDCGTCMDCKYHNETTGKCRAAFVAEYINKKLKGE